MKYFTKKEFRKVLIELGVKKNDNIFIFPETFRLGRLFGAKDKKEYFKSLLNEIMKIIGNKGSIFINTYTFDNSRKNKKVLKYDTKIYKRCLRLP